MVDTYLTIASESAGIYREKGSKFLAFAYPVKSIAEIKDHIDHLKKHYYDARHHCYAYRLGADESEFRMNDDGEPSGTAGKPIFGQILSAGITDVLVIVVRYFGGTLLGTSGLIRSYKAASADCLKNASIIEKHIQKQAIVKYPYEQTNEVMRLMNDFDLKPVTQRFMAKCEMEINIRASIYDATLQKFNNLEGVLAEEL